MDVHTTARKVKMQALFVLGEYDGILKGLEIHSAFWALFRQGITHHIALW